MLRCGSYPSLASTSCGAGQLSRCFSSMVLWNSTRRLRVAGRSPHVLNPESERAELESGWLSSLIRDSCCTSTKSSLSASCVRMHAFPTKIPESRVCRGPAILCEMISWIKLATLPAHRCLTQSSARRRTLSDGHPPTPTFPPYSHPSDPPFFPYAPTFTILQDHCHRPDCLQPSKAP